MGRVPIARDIVEIVGIGGDLLKQGPLRFDVREILFALVFFLTRVEQAGLPPDAWRGTRGGGRMELADEAPRAEGWKSFAKLDELGRGGRGRFLSLVMTSAGEREQPGRATLLEAAQPFADRGHGGSEEPRGGLDAALFGAFHQPQAMVVGVFHLTHQIEIAGGSTHRPAILPPAPHPALPPAGRPSPTASSRSNISASPGGYDVSRLFHHRLAR